MAQPNPKTVYSKVSVNGWTVLPREVRNRLARFIHECHA